jgi:hypothetical protein
MPHTGTDGKSASCIIGMRSGGQLSSSIAQHAARLTLRECVPVDGGTLTVRLSL